MAIDEVTGNVFVANGTNSIFILNGTSNINPPSGIAPPPPYSITGLTFESITNGVAFDNSTAVSQGTLYVLAGAGKIKKFTRNVLTEKYEPAGELTAIPPVGRSFGATGNGGLTVDAQGNLFAGEFTCQCIVKFNPSGTQTAQYNLGNPNPIVRPSSLAVDAAGNILVARAAGIGAFKITAPGAGEIVNPATTAIPSSSGATGVATDPARNKLYIALGNRVVQNDATALIKDFEFGLGKLGTTTRLAANSATNRTYVGDNGASKNVAVFGPPILLPEAITKAASDVTGAKATLNGIVNPKGNAITECKFEYGPTVAYGKTAPCEGATPTDSSDHAVTAAISGLTSNGATYHFRLWVNSVNGEASPQGADRTLVTADTVITQPATGIGATSASLNGIVRPEGIQPTQCKFEYGTTTAYGQTVPCSPAPGGISDDFDPHPVTGALTGLAKNTTYHFRLSASNATETATGDDLTFTTIGPPQIVEQRPLDVDQDSAILRAKINPSGLPTTYFLEFGTDTSYGIRIPSDHELFVGSGTGPVTVSANRTGLQEKSVYYFRVVATNAGGTTVGPDQQLETLNAKGLPGNRGFELVSPAEKGSAGSVSLIPGRFDIQVASQISEDGNAVVYPIQNGIPDSTAGGWTRWHASRGSSGWLSTQVSAASSTPAQDKNISPPSQVKFASPDLGCAVVETHSPLTDDTPKLSIEYGTDNLYRWNADDGSYDLITNRAPLNPGITPTLPGPYKQIMASADCSRIYFLSEYDLISGASRLYEWEEGTLRDAGVLAPAGGVGADIAIEGGTAKAIAGGEVPNWDFFATSRWNAVSPKGSLFFTAISNQGPDSGTPAIFLREDGGTSVIDVSQSETGVPTKGARFEAASEDGSRVFFRANRGIAASSPGPTNEACGPRNGETTVAGQDLALESKACDLYVYDTKSPPGERLTNLSADTNGADPIGAAIQGTVAVDDDGSHVYFAALGQLTPGEGRTYAQNIAGLGSANIYLAHDDDISYVTTLERSNDSGSGDLHGGAKGHGVLMRFSQTWSAETTANGGKLLFESAANLTGYESGGGRAAYLYSADTGKLSCVSCPPDGITPTLVQPSGQVESGDLNAPSLLARPRRGDQSYRPRSMSEDGSRIYFTSPDVLAVGALLGKRNIYEWHNGQVSFLTAVTATGGNGLGEYLDASADGHDVIVASAEQLVAQDKDFVSDVYDLRVDGGFPAAVVPIPCDPAADQCQGSPTPQSPTPSPASAGFSDPGNPPEVKPPPKPCRKGQVRRHGKCVKPKKRGAEHKRNRAAKRNRGGVK